MCTLIPHHTMSSRNHHHHHHVITSYHHHLIASSSHSRSSLTSSRQTTRGASCVLLPCSPSSSQVCVEWPLKTSSYVSFYPPWCQIRTTLCTYNPYGLSANLFLVTSPFNLSFYGLSEHLLSAHPHKASSTISQPQSSWSHWWKSSSRT
jgi:hypothetical protein